MKASSNTAQVERGDGVQGEPTEWPRSAALDQAQPTLAGKVATIRELYNLGAFRVKVGDIEAEFPPRVPQPDEPRDRDVEMSQQEKEREFRRAATGEDDNETDAG